MGLCPLIIPDKGENLLYNPIEKGATFDKNRIAKKQAPLPWGKETAAL